MATRMTVVEATRFDISRNVTNPPGTPPFTGPTLNNDSTLVTPISGHNVTASIFEAQVKVTNLNLASGQKYRLGLVGFSFIDFILVTRIESVVAPVVRNASNSLIWRVISVVNDLDMDARFTWSFAGNGPEPPTGTRSNTQPDGFERYRISGIEAPVFSSCFVPIMLEVYLELEAVQNETGIEAILALNRFQITG